MNISQALDQTADRLEQVDWKKIGIKIVEIWDRFFKILVILMVLTYLAGKSLGNWVHQTNDRLAANWVRLIMPPTPLMEDEAPLPAAPSPTPAPATNGRRKCGKRAHADRNRQTAQKK